MPPALPVADPMIWFISLQYYYISQIKYCISENFNQYYQCTYVQYCLVTNSICIVSYTDTLSAIFFCIALYHVQCMPLCKTYIVSPYFTIVQHYFSRHVLCFANMFCVLLTCLHNMFCVLTKCFIIQNLLYNIVVQHCCTTILYDFVASVTWPYYSNINY